MIQRPLWGACTIDLDKRRPKWDLLDGLIGGAIGAEMVTVVNGLIEKHGGVQGLVKAIRAAGPGGYRALLGWNR